MSMILYGCGFNAHGQLTNSSIDDHPQDIFRLQRLQCAHSIRILYVGWADTLCSFSPLLLISLPLIQTTVY